MKSKRFLSLLMVIVLCFSSFTAFAADDPAEEILVVSAPEEEYIDYSNMYYWASGITEKERMQTFSLSAQQLIWVRTEIIIPTLQMKNTLFRLL